jgi:hypothetical protein
MAAMKKIESDIFGVAQEKWKNYQQEENYIK